MSRRGRRPTPNLLSRWRLPLIVFGAVAVVALVALNAWLNSQPPRPDETTLHADLAAGRSGAEVTFNGSVVAPPLAAGDHEQIVVEDRLGDRLELDYNTRLGSWIPARVGDQLTIHGQLYIDSGKAGVHCLHSQTSSGCPLPGWVRLGETTYD